MITDTSATQRYLPFTLTRDLLLITLTRAYNLDTYTH
jgi:hypothetical protein